MPDGRQEFDLEKVVVLFTDPEEVKQGRSQLVVTMVIMVVVMMVIMVITDHGGHGGHGGRDLHHDCHQHLLSRNYAHKERPDPQWRGQAEV